MYAVIVTGGKQHRVREGDLVRVEQLPGEIGSSITLADVLMIGGAGDPKIGTPRVAGAKVTAEIVEQGLAKKVLVYHRKVNKQHHRLRGHRQPYTHLKITGIEAG